MWKRVHNNALEDTKALAVFKPVLKKSLCIYTVIMDRQKQKLVYIQKTQVFIGKLKL
uniref:Uncharacterized protein n=1 Tax=Anguilla anguilla TaxID=7936 RepID=A0A0E9T3I4_ANGAN